MFGDGATEEGVYHESLNFAALMKVPVLFLCENNGLAVHAIARRASPTAWPRMPRRTALPARRSKRAGT